MQQVNLFKGDPKKTELLPGLAPSVTFVYVDHVTDGGKGVVLVSAFDHEGNPQEFLMTANNFVTGAAAIKGWMIEDGTIPVKVNPGMAFAVPRRGCGFIEFATEVPLQNWKYTVQHARKLVEELTRFLKEAEGK